jgi:predicted enzyme related to lactoylglutathione lyase
MANQVVWVDIPVRDVERAARFYSAVLGANASVHGDPGKTLGVLPSASGEVGGCLTAFKDRQPSEHGPLIYLNCTGRLEAAAADVEKLGGKVLEPAHSIAPHGMRAIVLDSEGNRVALHSR